MNFSEWLESLQDPIYEANGIPQCPPGYKFNKKTLRCEPKTERDDVSGGKKKDSSPDNGPGFNVIGSHGQNGAPYAYEEQDAETYSEMRINPGDIERWDEQNKENEKKDKRMKYGKAGRPSSLKPGEVRKPDGHGGFTSNK